MKNELKETERKWGRGVPRGALCAKKIHDPNNFTQKEAASCCRVSVSNPLFDCSPPRRRRRKTPRPEPQPAIGERTHERGKQTRKRIKAKEEAEEEERKAWERSNIAIGCNPVFAAAASGRKRISPMQLPSPFGGKTQVECHKAIRRLIDASVINFPSFFPPLRGLFVFVAVAFSSSSHPALPPPSPASFYYKCPARFRAAGQKIGQLARRPPLRSSG